jgi:hypothetical protein
MPQLVLVIHGAGEPRRRAHKVYWEPLLETLSGRPIGSEPLGCTIPMPHAVKVGRNGSPVLEEAMRILLFVGAAVPFLGALLLAFVAQSAIQQIQAYILFLIAAVCLSGAGVVEAVNALRKDVQAQQGPRTQGEQPSA